MPSRLSICFTLQVEAKQLDPNSFWVTVREEKLESLDIFEGLQENFSTKTGEYTCKVVLRYIGKQLTCDSETAKFK